MDSYDRGLEPEGWEVYYSIFKDNKFGVRYHETILSGSIRRYEVFVTGNKRWSRTSKGGPPETGRTKGTDPRRQK